MTPQLQLFSITKVAVAFGKFRWKENTTHSINFLRAMQFIYLIASRNNLHYVNMYEQTKRHQY